jgi:hypothetical protein
MLLSLISGVSAYLTDNGFPVVVLSEGDRLAYSHCVTIARDRAASDAIRAPLHPSREADVLFARLQPYTATITVASSLAQPLVLEQIAEVDLVTDGVFAALYDWARTECTLLEISSCRLLTSDELAALGVVGGSVLNFRIGRAVVRRKYTPEVLPVCVAEGTLSSVEITLDSESVEVL